MDGDYAWYEGNAKNKTQPAGGKKPNAFGLYDLSGNVYRPSQRYRLSRLLLCGLIFDMRVLLAARPFFLQPFGGARSRGRSAGSLL